MRVELRDEARDDLFRAMDFYDRQRRGLGHHFYEQIFEDLEALKSQAGIHSHSHGFHRKSSKRFPFDIYYLVEGQIVDVAAILDSRQDPGVIALRLRS